jgi:hypothetical protein
VAQVLQFHLVLLGVQQVLEVLEVQILQEFLGILLVLILLQDLLVHALLVNQSHQVVQLAQMVQPCLALLLVHQVQAVLVHLPVLFPLVLLGVQVLH